MAIYPKSFIWINQMVSSFQNVDIMSAEKYLWLSESLSNTEYEVQLFLLEYGFVQSLADPCVHSINNGQDFNTTGIVSWIVVQ